MDPKIGVSENGSMESNSSVICLISESKVLALNTSEMVRRLSSSAILVIDEIVDETSSMIGSKAPVWIERR